MGDKFKINGMTCSACANRVERAVNKMEGVKEATVNFATETLTVDYDTTKLTPEDIEQKVEKLGYKVEKNIESHIYKVEGMSCSACANRVERVTKKMPGVENSMVNFATEKLSISYDADAVSFADIKAIVEKAGYKLIREDEKNRVKEKSEVWLCVILKSIMSINVKKRKIFVPFSVKIYRYFVEIYMKIWYVMVKVYTRRTSYV